MKILPQENDVEVATLLERVARMLVRCDANGKLFLYDIVQIKKETSTPLE